MMGNGQVIMYRPVEARRCLILSPETFQDALGAKQNQSRNLPESMSVANTWSKLVPTVTFSNTALSYEAGSKSGVLSFASLTLK